MAYMPVLLFFTKFGMTYEINFATLKIEKLLES